jgi:hypothetical protein
MPQMMQWMYIMLLKYGGFVTKYIEERFPPYDYGCGWRVLRHYTIKAQGRTMEVTIDDDIGIIDGKMSMERDAYSVYDINTSDVPVGYIPGPSQTYYRSTNLCAKDTK